MDIKTQLFALQDTGYRDFNARLIPTVNKETIIGVRTPELRKLAKEFAKTAEANEFLKSLPHQYHEENNLHGFLIEQIKDYNACISALDSFLPYVDNWATCDSMRPKVFKKYPDRLLEKITEWMRSEQTFTLRFGIEMLMTFYLDDRFKTEYLEMAAGVQSSEYYVNMMLAWFFATALAKQYAATVPFLEQHRLLEWTHNKTIRKAVESYRITKEQKAYLKSLYDKG